MGADGGGLQADWTVALWDIEFHTAARNGEAFPLLSCKGMLV